MSTTTFFRSARFRLALMVLASVIMLAACGRSTVVREGSSAPRYGASTVVQRGDTLYRIATSNGIAARDLAAWNGIQPPYTIYPGQRLHLYPKSGSAARTASAPTANPPARSGASKPPAKPQAPPRSTAPAPISSGISWRWPVDGALLSTFKAGEPTRQGIDIAGANGAPVRATADGVVVYSGSGLVGYGELIIVKHNEQWLSAYGHNRSRLVNEGALVKSGQQIAEVGRSGASRDMLHFEIRYNGKPVDPLQYLPKK